MENRARRRTTFSKGGWGGVGWGGVGTIPNLSLAPLLDLHLHIHVTLLDLYLAFGMKGWGGVGWGQY